jgi:tripartite-type tricarboxylate transporter receptor subunit TctC
VGLLLLALAAADTASAQTNYPNSPVRLISDSGPGGAVDIALRIIADGMTRYWKQPVVIVNQPGAAGSIAAKVASEAAPDGYTLYAPTISEFLAIPGKAPNLPLMVPRDFAAVGLTVEQPLAIAVSPKLGVKTLPELIDLARKRPGGLSYAVTGATVGDHLQLDSGAQLQQLAEQMREAADCRRFNQAISYPSLSARRGVCPAPRTCQPSPKRFPI